MFKYFKRGQQYIRTASPGWQKIRVRLESYQRLVARRIQQRVERLSPKALALWLMGFCIASSSVCAYLLITALSPARVASRAAFVPLGHPSHPAMMDTVFVYPDSVTIKKNK